MSAAEAFASRARSAARGLMPQWLYGPVRARRVRRLIDTYAPRTVQHRYGGFPLAVRLEDPLAEGWYDRDWAMPPEITALQEGRLGRGATVFDIGAHQGVVALILGCIVGPAGRVVAVEAEPHNARVAEANVLANRAANVTVVAAAGAARPGTVSFTESLNGVTARPGTAGAVEVPAVTVDELAERYGAPDVLLVDVEGFEGHVLAGAARTLAGGATDVFVELHDAAALAAAGSRAADVLARFPSPGWTVRVAAAGDDVSGDPGRPATPRFTDVAAGAHLSGVRCFVVARPSGAHASVSGSDSRP